MDWFRRSVGSFHSAWSGFPVSYRVLTGFLLVLLALVSVWGVTAAGRDGWVRIVEGSLDERAQIVTKLKELNIKTKLDGDAVSVPSAQADEAMLQLHGSKILGDEAFFKFLRETDLFGTADKSSKQWIVAIQGRLAAMIQGQDYVKRAQVQIAEVADSRGLWWANGRESTAAVVLQLKPGQQMNSSRVMALASLVSAAVPGLKTSGVKIVDQSGRFYRVDENDMNAGMSVRDQEIAQASYIEEKALRVLPVDSRVSAQVRLKVQKWEREKKHDQGSEKSSGSGADVESISIAVLVPLEAPDVPKDDAECARFVHDLKVGVRAAAGAKETDLVSIRVAPIAIAKVVGAEPAVPVAPPPPWIRAQGPMILLVLGGAVALVAAGRLLRGMAPAPEGNVIAEESLRSPGESILSAQDETLDKIRDHVRQSVTRNPREAADTARRWMSP
jgi:flagellar biosynthesis/type III secretory pathway M-ring protein FliF/YscJ